MSDFLVAFRHVAVLVVFKLTVLFSCLKGLEYLDETRWVVIHSCKL